MTYSRAVRAQTADCGLWIVSRAATALQNEEVPSGHEQFVCAQRLSDSLGGEGEDRDDRDCLCVYHFEYFFFWKK